MSDVVWLSPTECRIVFSDSPMSIDRLREMDSAWRKSTEAHLVFNRPISGTQLMQLSGLARLAPELSLVQAVMSEIAEHPELTQADMEFLFERGDISVRCSLALRTDLPDTLLAAIIDTHDAQIAAAVVFNPRLGAQALLALREKWAKDDGVSCAILRALGKSESE